MADVSEIQILAIGNTRLRSVWVCDPAETRPQVSLDMRYEYETCGHFFALVTDLRQARAGGKYSGGAFDFFEWAVTQLYVL